MVNDLGVRIRQQRLAMKLSQEELAQKLSIRQNTVSKYENNIKQPSLEVLILLAKTLEVSTDYLLGVED